MMKHISEIKINTADDDYEHGIRAGFCDDIGKYLLRVLVSHFIHYYGYYEITEDECRLVRENQEKLDSHELILCNLIPGYDKKYMGADYIRGYDVGRFVLDGKAYTYMDGPFLYEDGLIYLHLYYEGRHYAAIPHVMGEVFKEDGELKCEFPLRKMPGIKKCTVRFGDGEEFLCYGKEVENFEGMDEWKEVHDTAQREKETGMNRILVISNDDEILDKIERDDQSAKSADGVGNMVELYEDMGKAASAIHSSEVKYPDDAPQTAVIIDDGTAERFARFEYDIKMLDAGVKPVYGVKLKFTSDENDETGTEHILVAQTRKGLSNIYRIITNAYSFKEGYKLWPAATYAALDDYQKDVKVVGKDGTFGEICASAEEFSLKLEGLKPYNIPGAYEIVEALVYENAHKKYGEILPNIIEERIKAELKRLSMPFGMDDRCFPETDVEPADEVASRYLAMAKIAGVLSENGFLIHQRSTDCKSLVAYLLGMTDVNPLPAHTICPKCHEFELLEDVADGFDAPDMVCPKCGAKLKADGHNLLPDFGSRFLRNPYFEFNTPLSAEDVITEFIHEELENAYMVEFDSDKRTSWARIVFVPEGFDIYDFTPLCYFSESDAEFEYKPYMQVRNYDIQDEVFITAGCFSEQMELLDDLAEMTGVPYGDIALNDPKLYEAMLTDGFNPGEMVRDGKFYYYDDSLRTLGGLNPKNFSESLKRETLKHSTGAWEDNFEKLVAEGVVTDVSQIIGSRDDVREMLANWGADVKDAWYFSEKVRTGSILKTGRRPGPDGEREKYEHSLNEYVPGVEAPDWFYDACCRIQYLFQKGYCVWSLAERLRFAWYNLNYPLEYAAASLTYYWNAYPEHKFFMEMDAMEQKMEALKERIEEISRLRDSCADDEDLGDYDIRRDEELYNKLYDKKSELRKLRMIYDCRKSGMEFLPADSEKSDTYRYVVEDGKIRVPLHTRELDEA